MLRRPALGILVALIATPLAAEPRTVTGADGRTVTVADASRIVSVGGTVTEILYALGAGGPRRRRRSHQQLPRGRAEREAEGRLHAGAVGRGRPVARPDRDPRRSRIPGPPEVIDVLAQASVPFVLVPKAA